MKEKKEMKCLSVVGPTDKELTLFSLTSWVD